MDKDHSPETKKTPAEWAESISQLNRKQLEQLRSRVGYSVAVLLMIGAIMLGGCANATATQTPLSEAREFYQVSCVFEDDFGSVHTLRGGERNSFVLPPDLPGSKDELLEQGLFQEGTFRGCQLDRVRIEKSGSGITVTTQTTLGRVGPDFEPIK